MTTEKNEQIPPTQAEDLTQQVIETRKRKWQTSLETADDCFKETNFQNQEEVEFPSLPEEGEILDNSNTENQEMNETVSGRSTRRNRGNWKSGPAKWKDDIAAHAYRVSVKKALSGPYAQQTREAVHDEICNMIEYKLGHFVHPSDIPAEEWANVLSSFMFIKHKTKPDGRYDKTKARLVGDGSSQKDHMYGLISSSTVNITTVMLMFNIASYLRAKIATFDIKGAFLNAEFTTNDKPHYIIIRKEVAESWIIIEPAAAEFLTNKGELIIKLDKFIYGLKQSPIKFQEHLNNTIINKAGYIQSTYDDCLFMKIKNGAMSILSTHVDDILQISTSNQFITELNKILKEVYTDIVYNNADAYLGMCIS